MMAFATLLLSFAGFAALALSMPKHHRDLFAKNYRLLWEVALRSVGWALLAASLAPAIIGQGVSIGIVLWIGSATVAAIGVAMLLAYRNLWWRA
jgi:hypothetical protein